MKAVRLPVLAAARHGTPSRQPLRPALRSPPRWPDLRHVEPGTAGGSVARQMACAAEASQEAASVSSEEYNRRMKQQMGWEHVSPFEYHFDRGLYFHEVEPQVFCGSQPRNVSDIEYLAKEEKVTTILNLQQDRDLEYWGVDMHSLYHRALDLGVNLVRTPARDFDGDSLRHTLPRAVRALHEALREPDAKVYVHCTAGLGRSPGVCIAHMFWFSDFGDLDTSYKALTDVRPCGPKREAIRGATFDLLDARHPAEFEHTGEDEYTNLTDEQKFVLRYNVMRAT
mmetsp:Transcript_1406/g.3277  ORF Transcript_1406/g.3277 Transcript_1406/m.3277 type:complete len:283 (+) Transcript_1406:410-1258(+)|eukprot:jgi/Tetstr1/438571/TSEL_027122.t1